VIAVAGEALVDVHVDGEILRPFAGGGPFNTALALARLGVPTSFLGGISTDRFGRMLEATLADGGVDLRHVVRVAAPTALALVDTSGTGAAYSFYLEGSAYTAFGEADVPAMAPEIVAIHVGSLALATDPPASALVVDPNVRPTVAGDRRSFLERFERWVALSDIVKLSTDDVHWIYDGAGCDDVASHLLEVGAAIVALTRGPDGATAWTRAGRVDAASPWVEVVDTLGAGDAFGAGLLAHLWRQGALAPHGLGEIADVGLSRALEYASAVGALQCTRRSAWAPTSAEVDRFLERSAARTASGVHPGGEGR
jgi:fructokinase